VGRKVKHPSKRIAELVEAVKSALWSCDQTDRGNALEILVETLAAGAREVAALNDRIEALETSVSTWASLARGAEVERDRLKERIRKAQVVLHE